MIYRRNSNLLFSAIHDEIVFFDEEQEAYFGINKIGSYIWDLLSAPKTLKELTSHLCAKFDVSEEQCQKDITPFLNQMTEKKIIEEIHL